MNGDQIARTEEIDRLGRWIDGAERLIVEFVYVDGDKDSPGNRTSSPPLKP